MTPISENTHHPDITAELLMDMITVGHKHINILSLRSFIIDLVILGVISIHFRKLLAIK